MRQADELSWNLPFARSLSDRLFHLASCLFDMTQLAHFTPQRFTDYLQTSQRSSGTAESSTRQATSDEYSNATKQKIRKLRWHDR